MYIIAGCNGAGKTTASYTILPEMLQCKEFVNADNIAQSLSPSNPASVAFESGRIMLQRIDELLLTENDFAFETTLSTKSYVSFIKKAKEKGYKVSLVFFWLKNPGLAIQRVASRVEKGGHNIPKDIIERRYKRGISNLFNLFMPLCDYWVVVDNSLNVLNTIAEGEQQLVNEINNADIWGVIINQANAIKEGKY